MIKLLDLHTDYLWEGEIEGEPFVLTATHLSEATKISFGRDPRSSLIRGVAQASKDYFKNPLGAAAGLALVGSAIHHYKKAKRGTIHFHASNIQEKKLYKKMGSGSGG